MTLFVSAGEISGDAIAARVVEALTRRAPGLRVVGIGGPRMRAAGVHVAEDALALGAVGVSEALANSPALLRAAATLRRAVLSERPQAALLVGNDLFNALLARWLRTRRIPTVSVFPPQVWLWGVLAGTLGRSFDTILTSFPEEHDVYRARCPRADVRYIGHYLADTLEAATPEDRLAARDRLGLHRDRPCVALFPGSREQENPRARAVPFRGGEAIGHGVSRTAVRVATLGSQVPRCGPECCRCRGRLGAGEGVAARAGPRRDARGRRAAGHLRDDDPGGGVDRHADGGPVPRRPLSYAVVRSAVALRLMKSDTIALPNLVYGDIVVPELKQREVRPEEAARAVSLLLRDEGARRRQVEALARVRERLQPHQAFESAAQVVAEALRRNGRTEVALDDRGRSDAFGGISGRAWDGGATRRRPHFPATPRRACLLRATRQEAQGLGGH